MRSYQPAEHNSNSNKELQSFYDFLSGKKVYAAQSMLGDYILGTKYFRVGGFSLRKVIYEMSALMYKDVAEQIREKTRKSTGGLLENVKIGTAGGHALLTYRSNSGTFSSNLSTL